MVLGTPVIVTSVEAFLEIGVKNGVNGWVLDWNLRNVNIQEIYKTRLKFKYEPPKSTWEKEIAPGSYHHKYDGKVAIEITKRFYDLETGVWVEPTSVTTDSLICTKERAEYLIRNGVANE